MGGTAGGRVLTQPAIGIPCSVGSDREFASYFRARDALPSVMTGFKADVIRKRCPAPQPDLPNSLRRHLLDRCQTYLVENLHMSAWTSRAPPVISITVSYAAAAPRRRPPRHPVPRDVGRMARYARAVCGAPTPAASGQAPGAGLRLRRRGRTHAAAHDAEAYPGLSQPRLFGGTARCRQRHLRIAEIAAAQATWRRSDANIPGATSEGDS